MNEDTCPTNLVTDAPSDSDAFGAHGRIAAAIASLVRNSPGGKSIGLLGTWGAGKSTVVEILRNDLQADARFVVWLFDAWAHEGDSLRRMFLESLTETLQKKAWLSGKEWKERLEYLAGRRKVVEQSNTPRLSPLAVVLAISLLLVPLGLDLWSKRLDAGIAIDPALPVDWGAVVALGSALAPLLVFVGYVGWLLIRGTSLGDLKGRIADALTLFVRQTDTASRTETLDSGEPTSLEFERLFCDAMAAALAPASGGDSARRLVLVIDNLDRVGPEQALAVWSTLQTFVRQREGHEPWLNRVWCLLPFDGSAIRRLWPQEANAGSLADSFLDKTFQVRFEVPLPLLSDWKDYMMACLKEAMPSHTDDDFFRVYRLYAVRRTMGTPSPTPRELKLFVNQVGSLHRQWQDEIPLPDLSYYAQLQRDKVAVTSESIGQFPAPSEAGLVSPRVREHLAALAYGVPIDSARELLLREPILRALEAPAPLELNTLSDSSDAFWVMLEQALERGCEEWPTAEGGNLLHAAYALEESEVHRREPEWRTELLFRRIADATAGVGGWMPMDDRAVDGIAILGRRHPDLTRKLFDAFVTTTMQAKDWGTSAAVVTFLDHYGRLTKTLFRGGPLSVPIQGSTEAYKRFASALVTRDPDEHSWDRFPPASPETLLSDLCNHALVFEASTVEAVRVAHASGVAVGWKAFAESTDKRIRADGRTDEAAHAIAALHVLDVDVDAVDALKGLVSGGVARDGVLSDAAQRDPRLMGAWLYTLARFDQLAELASGHTGPLPPVAQWLMAPFTKEAAPFTDALAGAVIWMGRAETIFDVAQNKPQAAYVMLTVVSRLADMKPPLNVFPPRLLERWSRSFPNVDPYYTARALYEGRSALVSDLSSRPFRVDLAGVYAAVIDVAGQELALYDLCVRGVQQASAAEWSDGFKHQFGLTKLVESLSAKSVNVSLGQAAAEGMTQFVALVAKGSFRSAILAHETTTFELLDGGARAAVVSAVVRNASGAARRQSLGLLLTLIKYAVFDSTDLLNDPDAIVAITQHILSEYNDEWVERLATAISGAPPIAQLGDEARANILSLIATEQTKRTHEGARLALARLAAFFSGGEGAASVSQQPA
jgi:hypothetical protein